jgi:hypothetical protein
MVKKVLEYLTGIFSVAMLVVAYRNHPDTLESVIIWITSAIIMSVFFFIVVPDFIRLIRKRRCE